MKRQNRSIITIGNFDGVHLGHRAVIDAVIREARINKLKSIVITFSPHPAKILKNMFLPKLMSLEHRIKFIKDLGIDNVVVINFDKQFASVSPENFIKKLISRYNLKELVISRKFAFGKNKSGDSIFLKKLAEKYGFKLKIVTTKEINNEPISSTRIRTMVLTGKLAKAKKLLGRDFSIYGNVVRGEGIGKKYGFPTANLKVTNEAIPPDGVYACYVKFNHEVYKGALSIGNKPTFHFKAPKIPYIEVFIFDYNNDIYGKDLEVFIVKKIRDQIKFDNSTELSAKISEDVSMIRRLLQEGHAIMKK